MRLSVALVTILVILLAGCAGNTGGNFTDSTVAGTPAQTTVAKTTTQTVETRSTSIAFPTTTPEPVRVDPDNPFGQSQIDVSIDSKNLEKRDLELVDESLRYWENNSERYAGYPISFSIVPEQEPHRIEIAFVDRPIACKNEIQTTTVGCAPRNEETASAISYVQITDDETNQGTYGTLVHELGHTLGLGHSDEPQRYMKPHQTDPLDRKPITVAITKDVGNIQILKKRGIIKALNYLRDDPEVNESNRLDWELVDSVDDADLVIKVTDHHPHVCIADSGGSCFAQGEYEDQYQIILNNVDSSAVGWHVIYWLAPHVYGMSNVPSEFQESAGYDTRHGGWK